MIARKLFLLAVILAIQTKSSHQLPKVPILSAITRPVATLKSIPFAGLLNPAAVLKIVGNLRELAVGFTRADFMVVGMKTLEVFRDLIKAVNIPALSEMDRMLELAHGVLESVHPILEALKGNAKIVEAEETAAGNGKFFQYIRTDKTTLASLISDGFATFTSLPRLLTGF